MSLDTSAALSEGFRQTFTRNGLLLAVVFVLIGVVSAAATQTLLANAFDAYIEFLRANQGTGLVEVTREEIRTNEFFVRGLTPFTLPIPVSVAWLVVTLTAVIAEAATLVAVRVFFIEHTERISVELARQNIIVAMFNGIVGGVVVRFIVIIGGMLGLIAIIIGGPIVAAFLAMSFLFFRQEIAVENKTFVDAMADSWELAAGSRIELFLLVFLLGIVSVVLSIPAFVLGFVSPIATVIAMILPGVMVVFGTGVVTRAYAQLHAERAADTDEQATV